MLKKLFSGADSPEDLDKFISQALSEASVEETREAASKKIQKVLMSKYGDISLDTAFMQVDIKKLDAAFDVSEKNPVSERTQIVENIR